MKPLGPPRRRHLLTTRSTTHPENISRRAVHGCSNLAKFVPLEIRKKHIDINISKEAKKTRDKFIRKH